MTDWTIIYLKGIKMITLTDINKSLQDFNEWCADSYGDEYKPSLNMINAWQAASLRSQDKIIELQNRIKGLEHTIAISEPDAISERNKLGYVVVEVIGKIDEIVDVADEVEVDDLLHKAIPIDLWNELQEALENMPARAEFFTSPQPNQSAPVLTVALEALAWCSGHMPNEPVIEHAIKQVQEALASKGDKE